jgi:hypothetical protein
MSFQPSFENFLSYNLNEEGIGLDVKIETGSANVKIHAKIDTGATYCIFQKNYADDLGLNLEEGMRQLFSTATGVFYGRGFRVNLTTANLTFDSMVFFAEDESFSKNVLGRIGWLDKIVLGLVDYEGKLYLSRYSS